METIYLGLGSNLGDRYDYILSAIKQLEQKGLVIDRIATIIETDPVGGPPQGKFLNTVARAQTDLNPHDLKDLIQSIEQQLGRVRSIPNAPRTIDIDILLYGHQTIRSADLIIPHPRMLDRNFVMLPLKEIAPGLFKNNFIYHLAEARDNLHLSKH